MSRTSPLWIAAIAALTVTLAVALWPSRAGRTPGVADAAAAERKETRVPDLPTDRVNAPDFPEGFQWLNTERPLSLRGELKGQVVLLDFWTYCCINCMHILESLEQVEARFADEPFVAIGVHSNKFTNEGEVEQIRQAILRYRIRHPVVVDQNHRIWSEYAVRAWPTLMFIDAEGKVVGRISGEVPAEEIGAIVAALLHEGRQKGVLADGPPRFALETRATTGSLLAFPGKLAIDPAGGRLFIADSNHDRVLAVAADGRVQETIGGGGRGARDGSFAEARFFDPQGLAWDAARNALYVVDNGNHTIRRVDFEAGRVETVLGTGRQTYDRRGGGVGTQQVLNSPWDVAFVGEHLYIAMAGPHQLWRMDRETARAEAWVGSGAERLTDGTGREADLAQPSGFTVLDGWLYFADSEISAVRRVRLDDARVETLIGTGLFDYGDRDGPFDRALLQHPLGLANDGRRVFVADTYNHKVKVLDLDAGRIATLAGDGEPGTVTPDGGVRFNEPAGLAWHNGTLYVADTNNHRIVTIDSESGAWGVLEPALPEAGPPDITQTAAD